jgi:hypothetical protein
MTHAPNPYQQPHQPSGSAGKSTGNKTLLIVLGVVGGVLVLCCGSGFLLLAWVVSEAKPPEGITSTVNAPAEVAAGDSFQITVTVRNDGVESQRFVAIDVYEGYTNGIMLQSSDPPWSGSTVMFGISTYEYGLDIPPGGEQVVVLNARALRPGDYADDLDVCINSELSFVSQVVRTVVTPAGQP